MRQNRPRVIVAAWLVLAVGVACGGGESEDVAGPSSPTTAPPPAGVEEFPVSPSHTAPDASVDYAQTPPVGGAHNPTWQTCAFYDKPVPSETAVHSLEHGAIWITYRPDVPQEALQPLRDLARARHKVLVSRWDRGLPAPVVVTSWGRQLKLESTRDPRLEQFIRAFPGMAPEPDAPC